MKVSRQLFNFNKIKVEVYMEKFYLILFWPTKVTDILKKKKYVQAIWNGGSIIYGSSNLNNRIKSKILI